MKSVVILAAGVGSRLRPLTDEMPKALVPVAGRPICEYALQALADPARDGRCDVTVVVGYRGEQLAAFTRARFPFVRTVWNHQYARTNNMFSLYLGMTGIRPGVDLVFMNGDCLYQDRIIDAAVGASGSAVFCDPAREYDIESMKITTRGDLVAGIAKHIARPEAYAVSCDLYAVGAEKSQVLGDVMHAHIARGELNSWTEVALDATMRSGTIAFRPVAVDGYWYEIDNHQDLAQATRTVTQTAAVPACRG